MSKKKRKSSFLEDYLEWVRRSDNPYHSSGTISNFALRSLNNKRKYGRKDGLVYLIGGLIALLTIIGMVVTVSKNNSNYGILVVAIPVSLFCLVFIYRGISLIFGFASDQDKKESDK